MNPERSEERETDPMEAFSDGVFAFAITLLVLNLRDPAPKGGSLLLGLRDDWQSFFALATSFVTVLIMWVNHHPPDRSATHAVERTAPVVRGPDAVHDPVGGQSPHRHEGSGRRHLLGDVLPHGDRVERPLAVLCGGRRLLGSDITDEEACTITRQYLVAPLSAGAALAVSLLSGLASVVIVLAAATFFAIIATIAKEE